ncbi:MAG: hypothetical protein IT343_14705 [Candidatus Melainabacteria bacterium]|jgi:hypothetical protein|nr:hypothetical protein [Candidatus Melainabacteria bacterium]
MYGEYKRNWSTDEVWMNPAVHENYPEWKKARDRRKKFKPSEVTFLNQHGDRFSKDGDGKVTLFRYRDIETLYSISYDERGDVSSISSSAGWTWTRLDAGASRGWLIRNYFDAWQVEERECGEVLVDEEGIKCTAGSVAILGLPERPGSN